MGKGVQEQTEAGYKASEALLGSLKAALNATSRKDLSRRRRQLNVKFGYTVLWYICTKQWERTH